MKGKLYPSSQPYKKESDGTLTQTHRGASVAILLDEEADYLNSILEGFYGSVDDDLCDELEEVQDMISGIITNGKRRMSSLHSVLGAFDQNEDGALGKPESERI